MFNDFYITTNEKLPKKSKKKLFLNIGEIFYNKINKTKYDVNLF